MPSVDMVNVAAPRKLIDGSLLNTLLQYFLFKQKSFFKLTGEKKKKKKIPITCLKKLDFN
jgi:hypothetical protein